MQLRRIFDTHDGQILIIYDDRASTFHVATRPAPEASWGPPLTCTRQDDDIDITIRVP